MTAPRKIRWIIAHYPVYLFQRTAEKFKEELEKLCPGEFDLEIHSLRSYAEQYNIRREFLLTPPGIDGLEKSGPYQVETTAELKAKWTSLFEGLKEGEYEITQTQASIIGSHLYKPFHAIDLPFLFEDHDHVSEVLDGDIGDDMFEHMVKETDIRGLAFTYSGGYRVIGAKQGITNLSDLAETNLLTHTLHSNALFSGVGAKSLNRFRADTNYLADLSSADQSAVETTYLRFEGKHVFKTEHSMFTTTILTGSKFWDSLTEQQQQAFAQVAKIVARAERDWSVADAAQYEQDAEAKGISIVAISEQEKAQLKESAKQVYENLEPGLMRDLAKRIIEHRQ